MSMKSEIKDITGKIHTVESNKLRETLEKMVVTHFVKGRFPLDHTCEIHQGSEWFPLTSDFRAKLLNAGCVIQNIFQQEYEQRAASEAVMLKKRQETEKIKGLKGKCASGEWSLEDLQYIFHLVSNIPTTSLAASQEVDELVHAQNELINEVCKNPSLSEPLKIMYANAQLGMQQQILNNLDQLSSNQAQSNSILKQNQKSGNQKAAAGMLGGIVALNQLGDISDSLGGDE